MTDSESQPSPLRVGLDVTPLLSGMTGVARHTASLAAGLSAVGVDVASFAIGRGDGIVPAGTRRLRIPLRVVHRAWQAGLPIRGERLAPGPVDLIHSVDLVPPPTKLPLVATVHDLAALEFPELHPPRARVAAAARLAALDHVDAIVANSAATAAALGRAGIGPERVRVVHFAPHPLDPVPATEAPVSGPYLLAVGELTLRKDYATLFRAFARADTGTHRLVVVGPDGYGAEQIRAVADQLDLGDRLLLLGRVSDHDLSALYGGATALCFASVEEGFGIPLVEAMSRGLPIIASDIPVFHEVAADAAITAPVGDERAFADVISQVLAEDALRDRLAAAARSRYPMFRWEQTIADMVAAYRSVL